MDAIILIGALLAVYWRSIREVRIIEQAVSLPPEESHRVLKTRLNPDFVRDNGAFMKLYNNIVTKGTTKP